MRIYFLLSVFSHIYKNSLTNFKSMINFVQSTISQWRFCGLLSVEINNSKEIVYAIYKIIFHVLFFHCCFLTMFLNATVFSIGNLQKLIDNWYIFLTVLNMAGWYIKIWSCVFIFIFLKLINFDIFWYFLKFNLLRKWKISKTWIFWNFEFFGIFWILF